MVSNHFLLEESLSQIKQNKCEEALNTIDRLIKDEPNNNVAWYLKGTLHDKFNNFDEEKKAFEKAYDLTHLNTKADCIEILDLLNKLNDFFPYELKIINLRGHIIGLLRKYKGFLSFFQDHIKLLEKAVEFHENIMNYELGFRLIWEKMDPFLDSLKMENERITILNKSSKEVGSDSILLHIGCSLIQFSLFDQIIQWFEFLMEEYGIKSVCLFNNIGVSIAKRLDGPNATSYFHKALAIDEEHLSSLNNIGVCERSISYFDDVIKIDGENTNAYFNKVFASDNLEENLKYCEIILKKKPEKAEWWNLQGSINERLENKENALESYGTSLRINPKNENLLRVQGELLIKMEKFDEAIKNSTAK